MSHGEAMLVARTSARHKEAGSRDGEGDAFWTSDRTGRRLNWINITLLGAVHLGALLALTVSPRAIDLALLVALYLLTGFGITIGFHRLLAHRGYECSSVVRRAFAILGTAALQGGPVWWVGLHRAHHRWSDRHEDPHSPEEGFFQGHMGWMLRASGLARARRFAVDLSEDPVVGRLDRAIAAATFGGSV
jgi:stearoyl-CoA desaturase (delta-9 desaturase)